MPRYPKSLMGIVLMLTAMMTVPYVDVVAKALGQQNMPIIEIMWARMVFSTIWVMAPALHSRETLTLPPPLFRIQLVRTLLFIGSAFFFVWGLKYLPLVDSLAISFVQPLIITILSPVFLGEHVSKRRWILVAVGFIGVLIVIKPGFQQMNPGVFMALAAGICSALYMIYTRRIAGQINAAVSMLQTNLLGSILVSLIIYFFWQTPTLQQWLLFLLLGLLSTLSYYMITKSYDYAEASLLAPLFYSEIIMTTATGWWFFGEFPDFYSFLGIAILIISAIAMTRHEAKNETKS